MAVILETSLGPCTCIAQCILRGYSTGQPSTGRVVMAVILETSLGDLTIDLYTNERPRACTNFLKLCKIKYYNMCLFHTIQRNLVAQSGDPENTGRGGQSVYAKLYGDQAAYFEAEISPKIKHTKRGLVSMVNDGNNMHGSQFFITLEDDLDYMDHQSHTVFGEVSEGEDILDKLNGLYCDRDGKPYQNVRILHTVIIDDPYPDPAGLDVPPSSPILDLKKLENGRLEYGDDIDPFQGKTDDEVRDIQADKEAKANAQILEMIGDLPDQEVAPEDNVLFVCKLNPVTTDEDLEIIFSRFGEIKSCEVIRDQKTGESLQYAFIEFEKPSYCENAYFKMDNVLIDDRRIHVDFSQSVAKVKWKGKGKGVQKFGDDTLKASATQGRLYGMDFDSLTSKKKKPEEKSGSRPSGRDANRKHRSHREARRSRSPNRRREYRSPDHYRKRSRSPRERRRSRSPRGQRRSASPDHRDKKQSDRDRHSQKSHKHSRDRKRSRSGERAHRR